MLFPYTFIGTGMKKRKLIFPKDSPGVLISHPPNTSRSALTTYQPSSFALCFLIPSLVEDVYEVRESLRHTLFAVCFFVVLHISIAHLMLKRSKEAHVSPGVVMRLCITRGIFFFMYFSNPLSPAQTSFLKQSVLLKYLILKFFLCYADDLRKF